MTNSRSEHSTDSRQSTLDQKGMAEAGALNPIRRISYAVLFFYAVLCGVFIWRTGFLCAGKVYFCLFDDGMISMRYAQNLRNGHGLVWNAGESPVEGYTNFLWTIWMAFLHYVPVDNSKTSLLVMLSGIPLLLVHAWFCGLIAKRLRPEEPWVFPATIALCATFYPLMFWTLRGMEVGLLAMLLGQAIWCAMCLQDATNGAYRKKMMVLALLLVLGFWTRDDFLVPMIIVVGGTATMLPRSRRVHFLLGMAAMLGVAIAARLIFRRAYYGDIFPNTYHLKIDDFPLALRLSRGTTALWKMIVLSLSAALALVAWNLIARHRQWAKAQWMLFALVGGQMFYSCYVGGDAWEWMGYANRYICVCSTPLLVLISISLFDLFRTLQKKSSGNSSKSSGFQRVFRAVLAALLVLTMNANAWKGWVFENAAQWKDEVYLSRYGVLLGHTIPASYRIAVASAGAIPYFSGLNTIDLLGKNDAVVAHKKPVRLDYPPGHMKWDYEYSLGRLQPEFIAEHYFPRRSDYESLKRWGYVEVLPKSACVRKDIKLAHVEEIRTFLRENQ